MLAAMCRFVPHTNYHTAALGSPYTDAFWVCCAPVIFSHHRPDIGRWSIWFHTHASVCPRLRTVLKIEQTGDSLIQFFFSESRDPMAIIFVETMGSHNIPGEKIRESPNFWFQLPYVWYLFRQQTKWKKLDCFAVIASVQKLFQMSMFRKWALVHINGKKPFFCYMQYFRKNSVCVCVNKICSSANAWLYAINFF